MAFEWVAPVSGAIVGIAGIVAAYRSSQHHVSSARQLAWEERHQRRIEAAYPRLLDVLVEGGRWFDELEACVKDESEDGTPEIPEEVRFVVERGHFVSLWSPRVADLTLQWWANLKLAKTLGAMLPSSRSMMAAAKRARDAAGLESANKDRRDSDEYHRELDAFNRSSVRVAEYASKIRNQVWRELRGEDAGYLDDEASGR